MESIDLLEIIPDDHKQAMIDAALNGDLCDPGAMDIIGYVHATKWVPRVDLICNFDNEGTSRLVAGHAIGNPLLRDEWFDVTVEDLLRPNIAAEAK